jgi:hypothetical protein
MNIHFPSSSRHSPGREEPAVPSAARSFGSTAQDSHSSKRPSSFGHRMSDYTAVSRNTGPTPARPIRVSAVSQPMVARDDQPDVITGADPAATPAPAPAPAAPAPPVWSPSDPGTIHAGDYNIGPGKGMGPMGPPVPWTNPAQDLQNQTQADQNAQGAATPPKWWQPPKPDMSPVTPWPWAPPTIKQPPTMQPFAPANQPQPAPQTPAPSSSAPQLVPDAIWPPPNMA